MNDYSKIIKEMLRKGKKYKIDEELAKKDFKYQILVSLAQSNEIIKKPKYFVYFNVFQLGEIEKGMENDVNVDKYAKTYFSFSTFF